MSPEDVLFRLRRAKIVPVIRAGSSELALEAGEVLVEAGIRVLEVTMTVPGATDVIRTLSESFGDEVLLGAGTVLDTATADRSLESGADFVVSPHFDVNLIRHCKSRGVFVAPGALTPTEILGAWREGADVVKVFPCDSLGGVAYIKALRGPFPDIPLMPTGGIRLDSVGDFLRAGCVAVGVGGSLVNTNLLLQGKRDQFLNNAREFVAELSSISS